MYCECEAFQRLENAQITARKEKRSGWQDEEWDLIGQMFDHVVERPCETK